MYQLCSIQQSLLDAQQVLITLDFLSKGRTVSSDSTWCMQWIQMWMLASSQKTYMLYPADRLVLQLPGSGRTTAVLKQEHRTILLSALQQGPCRVIAVIGKPKLGYSVSKWSCLMCLKIKTCRLISEISKIVHSSLLEVDLHACLHLHDHPALPITTSRSAHFWKS